MGEWVGYKERVGSEGNQAGNPVMYSELPNFCKVLRVRVAIPNTIQAQWCRDTGTYQGTRRTAVSISLSILRHMNVT